MYDRYLNILFIKAQTLGESTAMWYARIENQMRDRKLVFNPPTWQLTCQSDDGNIIHKYNYHDGQSCLRRWIPVFMDFDAFWWTSFAISESLMWNFFRFEHNAGQLLSWYRQILRWSSSNKNKTSALYRSPVHVKMS